MDQPIVSIIIPCYNQAHFLADALDSCVGQSLAETEIILIDDGSTDAFEAVCQAYQGGGRDLKIQRQPNAGVAGARNAGIGLARGRYLQFLDADDYLHPDKLSAQVAFLEANPEYAYVYCDFTTVDAEKQELPNQFTVGDVRPMLSGDLTVPLLVDGYFPPHCPLVRKEALDLCGGFTPHLGGNADYELWLRLAVCRLTGFYLDRKLAYYRVYATSMSKNPRHMDETKVAALAKIAAEHPQALAEGVAGLQHYIRDLIASNTTLQEQIAAPSPSADQALLAQLARENQKLKEMLRKVRTVA